MFLGLVLAAFAVSAGAADKRFKMEGGDTLSIKGGDDWVAGDTIPDSPFGTLTIHGHDKAQWRLMIAPLPPHPTLTGDVGNLRIYVRNMARALDNGGVQVNEEHKVIEGANARGFYFKAHDSRKRPSSRSRPRAANTRTPTPVRCRSTRVRTCSKWFGTPAARPAPMPRWPRSRP